jgi:L-threonylcarbamoyladenylate synthase
MATRAPILRTEGPFLEQALEVLARGGLIISPTVTNYNLICDATHAAAIDRVFEVKRRSQLGPLGVGVPTPADIPTYVRIPAGFPLAAFTALLPGEINFIFEKKYPFPPQLTCGFPTLAISVSSHRDLGRLIARYGKPIAATSANISGQGNIFVPLDKAVEDLGDEVDLILDGGPTVAQAYGEHPGRVNTVVDFTLGKPWLVREGWVPLARVLEQFPNLDTDTEAYQRSFRARAERIAAERAAAGDGGGR